MLAASAPRVLAALSRFVPVELSKTMSQCWLDAAWDR